MLLVRLGMKRSCVSAIVCRGSASLVICFSTLLCGIFISSSACFMGSSICLTQLASASPLDALCLKTSSAPVWPSSNFTGFSFLKLRMDEELLQTHYYLAGYFRLVNDLFAWPC